MGGIFIDIWEKSNFLGAFGSQKGAKNEIVVRGALKAPPYGRVNPNPINSSRISVKTKPQI